MTETQRESNLARAWTIIGVLADSAPRSLGVTTISQEAGLSKAVVHRMLKELVRVGFLSFADDSKLYSLGGGARSVGLAALRSLNIVRIAKPELEELVRLSGETATLSLREGDHRIYVDQAVPAREVRMTIQLGARHPLHAGSSSKSILAALSDREIDEYFARHELVPLTENTIVQESRLREELGEIRRRGYATSSGERESDAGSLAVAIHGPLGLVEGAVSIAGPRQRFEPEIITRLAPILISAGHRIESELGYRPHGELGDSAPSRS